MPASQSGDVSTFNRAGVVVHCLRQTYTYCLVDVEAPMVTSVTRSSSFLVYRDILVAFVSLDCDRYIKPAL
jgi:hypothetical protein